MDYTDEKIMPPQRILAIFSDASFREWNISLRIGLLVLFCGLSGCANSSNTRQASWPGFGILPPKKTVLRIEVLGVRCSGLSVGRSMWYIYRAKVTEVISGSWTEPEVKFLHLQHAGYIDAVTRDCYVELRPSGKKLESGTGVALVAHKFWSPFWEWDRPKILKLKKRSRNLPSP